VYPENSYTTAARLKWKAVDEKLRSRGAALNESQYRSLAALPPLEALLEFFPIPS